MQKKLVENGKGGRFGWDGMKDIQLAREDSGKERRIAGGWEAGKGWKVVCGILGVWRKGGWKKSGGWGAGSGRLEKGVKMGEVVGLYAIIEVFKCI